MNGPYHFTAAEKYLAEAEQTPTSDPRNLDRLLRLADLHVRLAEVTINAPKMPVRPGDHLAESDRFSTQVAWRDAIRKEVTR